MYLFSLNNEIFESKEKIECTIKSDLESALKTELSLEILDKPREIITQENSIDSLDIERPSPKPNSLILTSTDKEVDEFLTLFRIDEFVDFDKFWKDFWAWQGWMPLG